MVPNLYPAFERQEVVIHSPEHIRSFAELDDEQVALVAQAWEERDAPFALINEGRLAGASLPHSHSQLVWTELLDESLDRLPELLSRSRSPGAEVSSQPFIRSAQARTSASSPATDRSPTASCSSATSFAGFRTSRACGPGTRGSIRDRRGTSTSSRG